MIRCAIASFAILCAGCATAFPKAPAQAALYEDLRDVVEVAQDGWIVDSLRLAANEEPALRSVCQVESSERAALDTWLSDRITLAHSEPASSPTSTRTLERTRALLRYADAHAALDCPEWLVRNPQFIGVQGDAQRWVVLAETHAFATYVFETHVPAIGGGGRALLGYGLDRRWTLAAGGELGASGTFLPGTDGGQGFDAVFTIALPVMLRLTQFSHLLDVELAGVARFERTGHPMPPGARIELGVGSKDLRITSSASYFMLYGGYEFHPASRGYAADNTIQFGTRLSANWVP